MEQPRLVSKRIVREGHIGNYELWNTQMPNGHIVPFEIMNIANGASAVLPVFTKTREFGFVEQFRPAIQQVITEIPAGRRDDGETFEACAARELAEEIGYQGRLQELYHYYSSPGYSNEELYLYLAFIDNDVQGELHLDENEFVELKRLSFDDTFAMLDEGLFVDGKTLLALTHVRKMIY